MSSFRYDHSLGPREQDGMNSIPFPPFPFDPAEELERSKHALAPMRLQCPPSQYLGAHGRLVGYTQGEAAKALSAARGKMDAEPVTHTHTHHHSYLESGFKSQPIAYDTSSRHAFAASTADLRPDSRGPSGSYIPSAGHDEAGRPFYRGAAPLASYAQTQAHTQAQSQTPELSMSMLDRSRHVSQELQDTDNLPSSRPVSLASLAALTAKGKGPKVITPQGIDSSGNDKLAGDLDVYYNSHRLLGQRSASRMTSGGTVLAAHQLQSAARIDTQAHHVHTGELIPQYHHHYSPQRAYNSAPHIFSVNQGTSHYQTLNTVPPGGPCQAPHVNYAKNISAPVTSAPTPVPKTQPASPSGPCVMGPDVLSPTKQEHKFAAQKSMLERPKEDLLKEALTVDFSRLGISQADHYLNIIGASPRVRPEARGDEIEQSQRNELHLKLEGQRGLKSESSLAMNQAKAMTTWNSPEHHRTFRRTLSAVPQLGSTVVTASLGPNHNTLGARDAQAQENRRQECGSELNISQHSPTTACQVPFIQTIERKAGDNFSSPGWDVGNLRRAGLVPEAQAPKEKSQASGSSLSAAVQHDIPSTGSVGPAFEGRYIGGHVSAKPDFVYRPVPWPVVTAEEIGNMKEIDDVSSHLSSRFPPPGLPPPPTLEQSPIGSKAVSIYASASDRQTRINETHKWYRDDSRWNGGLRERLGDLVKNNKNIQSVNSKAIRDPTERTTGLLAQAIANLQSYLDGNARDQAGNFANYGPVPDRCCEPCKDGNFSLFDVQPSYFKPSELRN